MMEAEVIQLRLSDEVFLFIYFYFFDFVKYSFIRSQQMVSFEMPIFR